MFRQRCQGHGSASGVLCSACSLSHSLFMMSRVSSVIADVARHMRLSRKAAPFSLVLQRSWSNCEELRPVRSGT